MMFRRLGYQVEQTPYSNDHGRDAVMKKDGKKYLLECKKYGENNSSGRPDLQKFHSAIMSDKAAKGYFVTTGRFSAGATRFAEKVPIELVDNDALSRLMAESKAQCDENDNYLSVCRACGELVGHNIRAPFDGYCVNGHRVRPSLSLDDILPSQFSSIFCSECSSPMRLKNGKWGKFWGCTKYPICKNKKRFRAI